MAIDSMTAQKRPIEADIGIALFPASSIREELQLGTLRASTFDSLAPSQERVSDGSLAHATWPDWQGSGSPKPSGTSKTETKMTLAISFVPSANTELSSAHFDEMVPSSINLRVPNRIFQVRLSECRPYVLPGVVVHRDMRQAFARTWWDCRSFWSPTGLLCQDLFDDEFTCSDVRIGEDLVHFVDRTGGN
jgi:hypothetical protein